MSGPYYGGEEEFNGGAGQLAFSQAPPPIVFLGVELTPLRMGILIGAIGFIGVGALAWFQLRPMLQQIQTVELDVQQKSGELTSAQQQIASMANVASEIEQARKVGDAVGSLLPTPENLETQLLQVNTLVDGSKAVLQSFVPNPPVPAGPEVPSLIQPQISKSTTQVSLRNTYEQGIALMSSIERLETLLQVNNLTMRFEPESGSITTNFDLDAFIYDSSAPLGSPTPAAEGTDGTAAQPAAAAAEAPAQPAPAEETSQ